MVDQVPELRETGVGRAGFPERIRNRAGKMPSTPFEDRRLSIKKPRLSGLFAKRLKGLEPSTFCMASGMWAPGEYCAISAG